MSADWPGRPSSPEPSSQTRLRRWEAPTSFAESTVHSASHPPSAMSPRMSPKAVPDPADSKPATFSTSRNRAPVSRTTCQKAGQSQRASSWAFRLPATEAGWQGMPPTTRSTRPRKRWLGKVRRSDQTGTSGREPSCMRAARTAAAWASPSQRARSRQEGKARWTPRSSPPAPLHRLMYVRGYGATFTPPLPRGG